jgi:hypothetical protein
MQIDGWKYYNHAAIQSTAPHVNVDTKCVHDGLIWQLDGSPLLARWTSDFDCGSETSWWYVIKDNVFDLRALKSKRRYEINKGNKNFDVKIIDPKQYKEEIFYCQVQAFSVYPKKYRPAVVHDEFVKSIDDWDEYIAYGAFCKSDGKLSGYALIKKVDERYISFDVQKTIPEYEKLGVNFALVYEILVSQEEFLKNGGYICDGARSISHETNFQDFLEKYFEFRKAYCKLHVKYKPKIAQMVKILYPFKKILRSFDGIKIVHKINAILKMEEIVRQGQAE